MLRIFLRRLLLAGLIFATLHAGAAPDDWDKELAQRRRGCDELFAAWRRVRLPQAQARLNNELLQAAICAERPGYVEEIAAGGKLAAKELRLPHRARTVPLHELRTFDGIETSLGQEDGYYDADYSTKPVTAKGWLVRRITRDAWEVWTPTHGWLFDGTGRALNEALPARGDGTGREWFGAFLPDGRWVTTDLQEHDDRLTFCSRDGQRLRQLTSAELAPPGPDEPSLCLIGWARSDKDGAGWIVNVGDNQGYATVHVGPEGPARVLSGIERWQLCRPRALGPRGFYISLDVPDDAGQTVLNCRSPGHGVYVGFSAYSLQAAQEFSLRDIPDFKPQEDPVPGAPVDYVTLPDSNDIFGFWPGGQDLFIGTEATREPSSHEATRTRKFDATESFDTASGTGRKKPYLVVDKTWFFDRRWTLQGWTRARRLADAADGRSMLLRTDSDGWVVTLRPDLRATEVRRFAWPDGKTADAVTLFDDLRLGLFVRSGKLVLAGW